jgi:hypothetical protein
MLGRLVLIFLQVAIGWAGAPFVRQHIPVSGTFDLFIYRLYRRHSGGFDHQGCRFAVTGSADDRVGRSVDCGGIRDIRLAAHSATSRRHDI